MLADSLRAGPPDGSLIAALSATPIDRRHILDGVIAVTMIALGASLVVS
jgi:hypothetical protein